MQIRLDGKFKSLSSFVSDELSDFTVITGKNGCGKSQLLELIKLMSERKIPKQIQFTINPNQISIQVEGIPSNGLALMSRSDLVGRVDLLWSFYQKRSSNYLVLLEFLLKVDDTSSLSENSFSKVLEEGYLDVESLSILVKKQMEEIIQYEFPVDSVPLDTIYTSIIGNFRRDETYLGAIQFIAKDLGKGLINLGRTDFYRCPIPERFLVSTDLFQSSLDQIFYSWANRRDRNQRLYFDKKIYKDANNSISDTKFVSTNPPPWEILNEIFSDNHIDYHFDGIERQDFFPENGVQFNLINNASSARVPLTMVSSGEQIVFGLVIKVFLASYFGLDTPQFPNLLILDEPDAHLHPEMSKLLVDILHETFVKKYGMKVIMVTHSPSTVALSPDESIYELKNHPVTELKKITKEEGLNILTSRLPTLSIDYQNHKQVFVESPTDVQYYQTIFNKVNSTEGTPFKLYFISNAMGKGNCDQVYSIVNDIRKSGNKTSFGIVDWDLKNSSKNFVHVHGENSRYSIENFICDPIYILTHLISINANNIAKDLNRDEGFNEYSVSDFSNEQLQEYVDLFFTRYYEVHKNLHGSNSDLVKLNYFNGKSVQVPKWYTMLRGHDLLSRIKAVFSALEGRYTSKGDLQKILIHTMAKCYPLIPSDSVQLIKDIINSREN